MFQADFDIAFEFNAWGWPEPYPAFWGPYAKKSFEAPEIGQAF